MSASPTRLTFEPAGPSDSDRISDLILGTPGQLTTDVGMRAFGIRDFGRARRLWRSVNRASEAWRTVTLARLDGETVGVLMTGPFEIRPTPALAARALMLFGPLWLLRLPRRMAIQRRVHTPPPAGAYRVAELHVDPAMRGRGFGGALLGEAEAQARAAGAPLMTLEVLIGNPAISLYRRAGFEIEAEATDPGYLRLAGVPGNYRMNRPLVS